MGQGPANTKGNAALVAEEGAIGGRVLHLNRGT